MKDQKYLIGVLTGVALTLAIAVILTANQPRLAVAESGPGQAGTITAVTAQVQANQDMLFLVDAQNQVVLSYIFYGSWGVARSQKKFEFLAARNFSWDRKIPKSYNNVGVTTEQIRDQILRLQEKEADEGTGGSKKRRTR